MFTVRWDKKGGRCREVAVSGGSTVLNGKYLTIIPRARMGSESIAHEAEGRMGY